MEGSDTWDGVVEELGLRGTTGHLVGEVGDHTVRVQSEDRRGGRHRWFVVDFEHPIELDRFWAKQVPEGFQEKRENRVRRGFAYISNALFGEVTLLGSHPDITLWDEDHDAVWHLGAASAADLDDWLTLGRQQALADLNAVEGLMPQLSTSWLKLGWEGDGITAAWVRRLVDIAGRLEHPGAQATPVVREGRRYLPRGATS